MENLVRLTCFAVILLLGKEQAYAFSPPAPSTTNSHLVSAARNRANLASSGCLRHKSFSLAPKSFQPSLFLRSNRKLKHVVASSRGSVDPNLDVEKYTEKAFEALQRLTDVAEKFSQQYIEADLLFYSLLQDETVQRILSKAAGKGSFSSMMRQLAQAFEEYARGLPQILGSAASTKQMGVTLRDALKEAQTLKGQYGDSYISVEHLLVAAIASPRMRKTDLLERFGITQAAVEKAIEEVRGGQKVTSRTPEATYDALNKYGRDLTEEAKAGKLDPVIGRDEEIRRTMQILSRRTKNNPILLGEPGVGKTAIVEGLAQRVASGDVPASLQVLLASPLYLDRLLPSSVYRLCTGLLAPVSSCPLSIASPQVFIRSLAIAPFSAATLWLLPPCSLTFW